MGHRIIAVEADSIAEEIGCEAGDELLRINGKILRDIIDYEYFSDSEFVELEVRNGRDGEVISIEIEKDEGEPLGFVFDSPLMSPQRTCANECLFCFVDQMPCGLRKTLYVKDDDWRTSFMYGSFVTLTNVGERELQRIIDRKISPLYVSVQATEPALRAKLLGNPRAGQLMEQLRKLADGGIRFHAQLVLCHGYNDGDALDRSLRDLWSLYPAVLSVACVPVGLTEYRENLPDMKLYTREQACEVLDCANKWRRRCMKEQGTHFIYPSDEFYSIAHRKVPKAPDYEGFPQIENGVGMIAKFEAEFEFALESLPKQTAIGKRYTLATGESAYPWLKGIASRAANHTGAQLDVLCIKNDFFGESVTVAGLIVGQDLVRQTKEYALGDKLIIPRSMLREGEDVFLDHMTLQQVQNEIPVPICAIETDGESFLRTMAGQEEERE